MSYWCLDLFTYVTKEVLIHDNFSPELDTPAVSLSRLKNLPILKHSENHNHHHHRHLPIIKILLWQGLLLVGGWSNPYNLAAYNAEVSTSV